MTLLRVRSLLDLCAKGRLLLKAGQVASACCSPLCRYVALVALGASSLPKMVSNWRQGPGPIHPGSLHDLPSAQSWESAVPGLSR